MNKVTTLGQFIIERQSDFQYAKGELSRLLRDIGIAAKIVNKGLTLLSSIYAARILGKERFGEFGIIQNSVASFGLAAGLGFGLAATKYVAEFRATDPARVARILALSQRITYVTSIITTGLVFVFADNIAGNMMAAPSLAPEVRIASVMLFLAAINGVQNGALSGFEAFRDLARISLITGVAGFVLTIGGVWFAGLPGAVWATVASTAVAWALCKYAIREQIEIHKIPQRPVHPMAEWAPLWRFTLPAVLSGLSVVPVNWACNLILVNQPNGYAEMGLLNAAIQWRNIILFIPSVLISVSLPMLTNLGSVGEFGKQRKVLLTNIALAAFIGFSAAALVSLAGKYVMASYGPGFADGRSVLVLQVFAAAIAAVVGIMGQFLISCGALWSMIYLQIVWALINIGLTWLHRTEGAKGVATAYLIAYVSHLATMSVFTLWKLRQQSRLPGKVPRQIIA